MKTDKYQHLTDQQLLEHFYQKKDNYWIGVLLQRYTLLLLGVCMKYLKNEEEARDGVQQVFLKCIEELKKYRVDYFKSWVYMVAKNYCLMKLRDKGKMPVELDDRKQHIAFEDTDQSFYVEKDKTLTAIQNAMPLLNDEQRQCIHKFYLEKKSYQEICEQTGFSMMQVKSFIQNGKRNLKIMVEKNLAQQNAKG